jgi:hypothetical protein
VDDDLGREERAIYVVAIASLVPVVIAAIARYGDFDGGTTLSLLVVVVCVIGLFRGRAEGSARVIRPR